MIRFWLVRRLFRLCPLLACTSCHLGWFSDFRERNTTDALK
jgi:hypothetical protein